MPPISRARSWSAATSGVPTCARRTCAAPTWWPAPWTAPTSRVRYYRRMPERPDLRHIAVSLREALDGLEREALVDILTYVLNEYVVEGPPPLHASQVERLEDLQGLSLAALVQALQVRLDTPGLELFKVEGDEVRVQTASGWVPLQPGRAPAANERPAAPGPAVAAMPAPQRAE